MFHIMHDILIFYTFLLNNPLFIYSLFVNYQGDSMISASETPGSNCSSRSSETSSPHGLSPTSSSSMSMMSATQKHPFYFGNNNFHSSFPSAEKSKFATPEEDARWFDYYYRTIKPEPLDYYQPNPSNFYQQHYNQTGFGNTPPQFYFHTQNIIQNNINNRVQNIFANDATVHQDDNNTLVNLALPGGHTSMESRSQVDSYYYTTSKQNNRNGLNEERAEESSKSSQNGNKYKEKSNSEDLDRSEKELPVEDCDRMIEDGTDK